MFLAGECREGACGRTGDDTGRGILEPRAAAGDVSPVNKYHSFTTKSLSRPHYFLVGYIGESFDKVQNIREN